MLKPEQSRTPHQDEPQVCPGALEFLKQDPERAALRDRLEDYIKGPSFKEHLPKGVEVDEVRFLRLMGSVVFAIAPKGPPDPTLGKFSLVAKFSNPEFADALSPFGSARERYDKLIWCTKQITAQGFPPVPRIHASGSATLAGKQHDWILQDRIAGTDALPEGSGADEKIKLWEAAGRAAAGMHRVSPRGFGAVYDAQTRRFSLDWEELFNLELSRCKLEELIESGFFPPADAERFREETGIVKTLNERYQPALNHLDLEGHNVFVNSQHSGGEGSFEITGVIDFDFARSAPGPVYELAQMRLNDVLSDPPEPRRFVSFLKGLGVNPVEFERSHLKKDVEAILAMSLCQMAAHFTADDSPESKAKLNRIRGYFQSRGIIQS